MARLGFFLKLVPKPNKRWPLSGCEPTSVGRVAPDRRRKEKKLPRRQGTQDQ